MPERSYSSPSYRYGFNGMEKDDEVKGSSGTSYNFGARLYDSRLGRWFSLDPESHMYPDMSDYSFGGNSPIMLKDEGGTHLVDANGNIVYTVIGVTDVFNGIKYIDVYIYANDGTKHKAEIAIPASEDVADKIKDRELFFCHGYSQTDGKISPFSGDPIEGLLKGDRNGELKEHKLENAKAGDIAIFRVTQEHVDKGEADKEALGTIHHTAILNKDGTYTSKNGSFKKLKSNATLKSLTKEYGNSITFVSPVENKTICSLEVGCGPEGTAEYTEEEVQDVLSDDSIEE